MIIDIAVIVTSWVGIGIIRRHLYNIMYTFRDIGKKQK